MLTASRTQTKGVLHRVGCESLVGAWMGSRVELFAGIRRDARVESHPSAGSPRRSDLRRAATVVSSTFKGATRPCFSRGQDLVAAEQELRRA